MYWQAKYSIVSFSVATESNSVNRDRVLEPEVVYLICPVQTCFIEKQQSPANNWLPLGQTLLGTWVIACGCSSYASALLLQGCSDMLTGIVLVSPRGLLSFVLIFTIFSHWLFIHVTSWGQVAFWMPKALFVCKKAIFNLCFLSSFNDKLLSACSLSSRHRGAMVLCTFDGYR